MRLLVSTFVSLAFAIPLSATSPVYDDGASDIGAGTYDGEAGSPLVGANGETVDGWANNGGEGNLGEADAGTVDSGAGIYNGEAGSDLVEADTGTLDTGGVIHNGETGSDLVEKGSDLVETDSGTINSGAGIYNGEAGSDLVDPGTVDNGAGTYNGEAVYEPVGEYGESNTEYYEEMKVSKKKLHRLLDDIVNAIKDFLKKNSRPENKLIRKMAERFLTQMETIEQEVCNLWEKEGDKTKAEDCRDFMDKVDKVECGVTLGQCAAKAVISVKQAAKCIVKNSVDCITSIA